MTNSKITEINQAVIDALKHGRNDEKFFQLGIELGKAIASAGIEFERLPIFIENEIKAETADRVAQKMKDIASLIERCFYLACLKQIRLNGSITFTDSVELFDDKIGEEFFVHFVSIWQEDEEQDYKIQFEVVGEIAEVFDKFNAHKTMSLTVFNLDYTSDLMINEADELKKLSMPAYFRFSANTDSADEETLSRFFDELDKATMFKRLKHSAD